MGGRGSQPGLELASHQDSRSPAYHYVHPPGLEVRQEPGLEVQRDQSKDGLIPVLPSKDGHILISEEIRTPDEARRRKRRFIWGGIALGLIIVVAVVGGVVGSGVWKPKDASPTQTSAPASTVLPSTIRANSKIAVTGWRDGSAFNIRLFYQGADDALRMLTYSSATDDWSAPLALPNLQAKKGTALAAATYIGEQPVSYSPFPNRRTVYCC